MQLIKLNAIDSTNDFLKSLSQTQTVKNFTVVSAETQTKGKGQMGAIWKSESGKNLIMSLLVKGGVVEIMNLFQFNTAVAVAVIQVLERHAIPKLSVKWPNDIMSGNKKIGGILIENSFRSDGSIDSIVGLGLNVNQTNFENLPLASSLALVCDKVFDKDILLVEIAEMIIENLKRLQGEADLFFQEYTEILFKKGIPMPFENQNGTQFMGMIDGVEEDGKLRILLEDGTFATFGIKEIKMLY